jgi:putative Mg2+ transporter-C (MgtC) family protein
MKEFLQQIQWPEFLPILVAVVLGGMIGVEREVSGKAAGLRTNTLICLGAALFTHLALNLQADAAKMLAGVITGVGFIGGGAVLRDRGGIHGITTAATIWLVTGIGIACGMRMYVMAIGITILTLIVLLGMSPLDKKISKVEKRNQYNTKPIEAGEEEDL